MKEVFAGCSKSDDRMVPYKFGDAICRGQIHVRVSEK